MPREKIQIDLAKAEELAGKGLTIDQIAEALGVGLNTLNRRRKESDELDAVIKKGRATAIYDVANALYQSAMSGNVTAMIFFLKARAGWSDKQSIEVSGVEGKPIEVRNEIPQGIAGLQAIMRQWEEKTRELD